MTRTPNASKQTRALLLTLMQAPTQWRYGYDLSQETGLKSGTLYPILLRLSDQGLLESKWVEAEEKGRPPRHAYRLSPEGAALARSMAAEEAVALETGLAGARA